MICIAISVADAGDRASLPPPSPAVGLLHRGDDRSRCRAGAACAGRSPRPRCPRSASSSAACSAWPTMMREGDDGHVRCPRRSILALPIGTTKSSSVRHLEGLAVEDLVLEEDHRVRVADRRLQQALGVGRRLGRHHLQARAMARTRPHSPGCAGRRRAPPRRSGRGTRSGSPSGRPTCRASWPPS